MIKMEACAYSKDKIERLRSRFSQLIIDVNFENSDMPNVFVEKEKIISFLSEISKEEGFEYNFLSDLTAYDYNPDVTKIPDYNLGFYRSEGAAPRFIVVYHLLSLTNKDRIRVKVALSDSEGIASITQLWETANWLEREVWDLYGIKFLNHPDLRRIMLDDRWDGHPLRKDYPIKKYQRFEDNLDMAMVGLED